MFDDQYLFLSQYLSANKQILNGYSTKCLQIIVSKYLVPEGVERAFILDLYVNVASNMWLLHILMNPIFFYFFSFLSHIASSCNITSV